jgi:hypothetical protein
MAITDYDPFNFMIVLLFIYAVLIGFIVMLIYNNIHGSRRELVNAFLNSYSGSYTDCNGIGNNDKHRNCIPAPTDIKGQRN